MAWECGVGVGGGVIFIYYFVIISLLLINKNNARDISRVIRIVDYMTLIDGCVLYPAQYNFIWRVSFVSAFSCAYAAYRGHYDIAIVPCSVLLTSLNYWRLPTYGWRRNLDIACVCSGLIYQNIRAYRLSNAVPYYYLMGTASLLYPMSVYFYKKKCYWWSTYVHCMLHIIANIGNVVLYSGDGGVTGVCHPPRWSAAAFCPLSYACFFRGHIVSPI